MLPACFLSPSRVLTLFFLPLEANQRPSVTFCSMVPSLSSFLFPTSSHCTFSIPHYRFVRLIAGTDIYFTEGFPSMTYPNSNLGKGREIWCGFPPLCTQPLLLPVQYYSWRYEIIIPTTVYGEFMCHTLCCELEMPYLF